MIASAQTQGIKAHERTLREAHLSATKAVKKALLERVCGLSPGEFERLVVRLLVVLRYGCKGEVTGKTGDGGIDGVIYEDLLGFSRIYVQAKRWMEPVGRPEVQKFSGALTGMAATKGVLITVSTFTKEARKFVTGLPQKVILIDGSELVELMYDCNLGVMPVASFELKTLVANFEP
jgi:restriction system protein